MPLHVLGRGRPSGETPSRTCHAFHEEFTSNSAFNYSTKKKMEMQKCRPYRINIKPSQKTSWLDFWHTLNFSIYVVFFLYPPVQHCQLTDGCNSSVVLQRTKQKKKRKDVQYERRLVFSRSILTGLLCQGFENNKRQKILFMFRFCCPLQHHCWLSTGPRTSDWTQPPNPQLCCSRTKTQTNL